MSGIETEIGTLEAWAQGQARLEAVSSEPLAEVLLAARRASAERMSDADATRLHNRVCTRVLARRVRLRRVAGIAASLAMAAAFVGLPRRAAPPSRLVVKQVLFESVREGKVVRLEMTVYREVTQERNHVAKPPL